MALAAEDKEVLQKSWQMLVRPPTLFNSSKSTVKISEGANDFEIELCTIAKSSIIPV